jgi:hypothetical protein
MFLQAIRVTMGKKDTPKNGPSEKLVHDCLNARHSPIRVFNFAFLIEDIPSNTSVHLCRHVHAVPYVSSLRNDRQNRMDGDKAPRDTPVDMILYCNAEEFMTISNKRLCNKAAPMTRRVVQMMCLEALDKMPELTGLLVPMCQYHGGVCHEIDGCGRCTHG